MLLFELMIRLGTSTAFPSVLFHMQVSKCFKKNVRCASQSQNDSPARQTHIPPLINAKCQVSGEWTHFRCEKKCMARDVKRHLVQVLKPSCPSTKNAAIPPAHRSIDFTGGWITKLNGHKKTQKAGTQSKTAYRKLICSVQSEALKDYFHASVNKLQTPEKTLSGWHNCRRHEQRDTCSHAVSATSFRTVAWASHDATVPATCLATLTTALRCKLQNNFLWHGLLVQTENRKKKVPSRQACSLAPPNSLPRHRKKSRRHIEASGNGRHCGTARWDAVVSLHLSGSIGTVASRSYVQDSFVVNQPQFGLALAFSCKQRSHFETEAGH